MCVSVDGEHLKMKLVALAVILACCLVHVYSDCGASQVSSVQQQWTSFSSDAAQVQAFGAECYQRSVPLYEYILFGISYKV